MAALSSKHTYLYIGTFVAVFLLFAYPNLGWWNVAMCVVYHLLQTQRKPGLEFSPSYLQRFKFEKRDRTWEAEALKYIPFKDNLDLCLLTHSVTAHLVHIGDPPEIPSHHATWDATAWKEPKELPFHLHFPLVNQELRWGVGFTKTHMHFTASVFKILPKPQLKAFCLS